jgi:hypothetical protein
MQTLSLRLTHTYVGTYQHLDKWEDLGTVDEIGTRELPPSEEDKADMTEPLGRELFALVKSEAPEDQIRRALEDTYTSQGCAHDYDCCGCRSFSATDVKRVTGDLWRVEIHSSRNY